MDYIGSFTKTLACVVIISFILKSLLPRSTLEKYINFVIGLVVSITLVGAFFNAGAINFDCFDIEDNASVSKQEAEKIYNTKVRELFEKEIKRSVKDTVENVCGCESECDVMLKVDEEGNAAGIEGVYVRIYGIYDEQTVRRALCEKLGVDAGQVYIEGADDE